MRTYLLTLLLTCSFSFAFSQYKGEYLGKAKECSQKKDYECVEENISKLIPLEKNKKKLALYYTNYAIALKNLNKTTEALVAVNKSIELNKNYFLPYFLRAILNQNIENENLVKKDLEKFLELYKKGEIKTYHFEKIYALIYLQKTTELKELLINPNLTEKEKEKIQIGLIAFKKKNKQYEEAINDYKKLIEENPKNAIFHNNLADTYLLNGQYDEGLISVDKSIELDKDYVMSYITKAELLMKKNQKEEACIYINKTNEWGSLTSKAMEEFKHCQK